VLSLISRTVPKSFSKKADVLNPWPIAYQGGNWTEATQCAIGGDNSWQSNHAALNHDINDHWVRNNTPYSWSFFTRSEIPVHFSIAEAWTVGDMYQVGCGPESCVVELTLLCRRVLLLQRIPIE
jgi:phospholipase C